MTRLKLAELTSVVGVLVLGLGACVAMAPIPESALAYSLPVLASSTLFVAAYDNTPLYAHTVLNVFTNYLNQVAETEIDFPIVRASAAKAA